MRRSGPRKTEVPAIPEISRSEQSVDSALKALKEATEVGYGRRGDPLDRFVTLRDLRDGGIATIGLGGRGGASIISSGGSGAPFVPNDPPDYGNNDFTPPPAPTGVRARGVPPNSIMVLWDPPNYSNHAYAEIFVLLEHPDGGAPTLGELQLDLPSNLAGRADGTIFMHRDLVNVARTGQDALDQALNPSVRYYWVRFVSTANVRGPFAPLLGASAAMSIDPVLVLDAMIANIRNTAIYSNLRSWIGTEANDPILAAGGVRAYINQQDGALGSTFFGYFNSVIGVSPLGFTGQSVFQRLDYVQASAYPDHVSLQNLQTWQAGLSQAANPTGQPVSLQMLSYSRISGANVVNVTLNTWSLNIASFPVGATVKISATAGDPLFSASGTRCVITAHISGGVALGITPENTAILPVTTLGPATSRSLTTDGPPQSQFLDFIASVQRNIFVAVEPGTAIATELNSISARIGSSSDAPASNLVPNSEFDDVESWTLGSGWSISGGVAVATSANGALVSQLSAGIGKNYRLTYTLTRVTGTVTPSFGGKTGTSRSATGTYTEQFTATTSTAALQFAGAGLTGSIDGVDLRDVSPSSGSLWAQTNALNTASVNLEGRLENIWSVNMRQQANGLTYAAGFGLSLETNATTGESVSTFLINANQFALMGPGNQKGSGVTGFYAVAANPDVSAFLWLTTAGHGLTVGDKVVLSASDGAVRLSSTNLIANGSFADAGSWTLGTGWTIAGGAAVAASANSAMTSPFAPTAGKIYSVTYTVTLASGSVRVSLGSVSGLLRTAPGTYTEEINAISAAALSITGFGFSGTIDNISVASGVYNPFGGMVGKEGDVVFTGSANGQPLIQVFFRGAVGQLQATPPWASPQQAAYNRSWVERFNAAALPNSNIPFVVDTERGVVGIRGKLIVDGLVRATSGEFDELTASTAFIQSLQAEIVNANVVIGQRLIAGTPGSGALTPGEYNAISNFIVEMNNPVTNEFPLRFWNPSTQQTAFSLDRLGNLQLSGNLSVGSNAVIGTTGANLLSIGGSGADGNYVLWCGPKGIYGATGGGRTESSGLFWIKDNARAGFNANLFLGDNAFDLPFVAVANGPGATWAYVSNSIRTSQDVGSVVAPTPLRLRARRDGSASTYIVFVSGMLVTLSGGSNNDDKQFDITVELVGSSSLSAPAVAVIQNYPYDDWYPESLPFSYINAVQLPAGDYYVRIRRVHRQNSKMSIISGWTAMAMAVQGNAGVLPPGVAPTPAGQPLPPGQSNPPPETPPGPINYPVP